MVFSLQRHLEGSMTATSVLFYRKDGVASAARRCQSLQRQGRAGRGLPAEEAPRDASGQTETLRCQTRMQTRSAGRAERTRPEGEQEPIQNPGDPLHACHRRGPVRQRRKRHHFREGGTNSLLRVRFESPRRSSVHRVCAAGGTLLYETRLWCPGLLWGSNSTPSR